MSEFFYGIAKMRKVDLSCRRISKLVTYTKTNDALKADYQAKAEVLNSTFFKVNAALNDTTVDNTMTGAKAKLAEFASYKQNDKPVIIANFLTCESLLHAISSVSALSRSHLPCTASHEFCIIICFLRLANLVPYSLRLSISYVISYFRCV